MTNVTLTVDCDRKLVAAEVSSQRMVEWVVCASEVSPPTTRAPLNLALVLDRSGSMQGEKLRYVQQAACHVLDLLNHRDRVAVVAYDDQILLIGPGAPMNDQARSDLKTKIQALQPGGWTNLGGGWLEGCRQAATQQLAGGVNRALLLTDGLANRGITDIEELMHHARELRRRGISTSTFGVGLDFNEQLLEALAAQGGGHFYYIERPNQIPDVFRQELGELLTVVAREAFLSISIPRGVAVELLGDLPHERQSDRLRIFLGELCAGERRMLYTRVLTPPNAPGTAVSLCAQLGYADLEGGAQTSETELLFSYVREADVMSAPLNQLLLQRVSEVEIATATAQALKLEREGQRREAQALLQRTLVAAAPYMPEAAAATYQALADQMAEGLAEEQRKQTHFVAYKARQSRK